MAILSVQNLSLSFSERVLFEDVSFDVEAKDKIGFIGVNGAGKTTIFKIISGLLEPGAGGVFKAKDVRVGWMEQHANADKSKTVYNELLTVFSRFEAMEQQLETLARQIEADENGRDALIAKQLALHEQYENDGGLTYKSRTRSALMGLGFSGAEMELPCGALSGGQLSKLSLAKLLLSGANLLLLDEPTNHLDIPSVEWLEGFIRDFRGAVIVISHDRYFLDAVTNRTIELEHQSIASYSGSYTEFMKKKEKINEDLKRRYDNDIKEIKRIEGIIEQQKRWGRERNFITAESKQKQVDRLKDALVKPDGEVETIHFSFNPKRESGNDVLICEDLSKAYGEKTLFEHVNLHITKGDRVFLLGANGCGKTTLFKILTGRIESGGDVRFGANVDVGYFDQVQSDLHLDKTALDEVWDTFPGMTQTQVRTALGSFLFKGDDVFKPVKALSGGERARVALLKLMLAGSNFLLLDEPTNHLDTASREALEDTLKAYGGTMFIISHDRYFINKLAGKVITLSQNGAREYLGNYDNYLEKAKGLPSPAVSPAKEEKPKQNEYFQRKEQQAARRRLQTKLKNCEALITQLETQAKGLENELNQPETASDFEKLTELTARLETLHREQERQMELWEEISLSLEEFEGEAF